MSKYNVSDYERVETHLNRCRQVINDFNSYGGDKNIKGSQWLGGRSVAPISDLRSIAKVYVEAMLAFNDVANDVYPDSAPKLKKKLLNELEEQMDILDNLYFTEQLKPRLSQFSVAANEFYAALQSAFLKIKKETEIPTKKTVRKALKLK